MSATLASCVIFRVVLCGIFHGVMCTIEPRREPTVEMKCQMKVHYATALCIQPETRKFSMKQKKQDGWVGFPGFDLTSSNRSVLG